MTINEILSSVDHTLLSPTATIEDIYSLCEEAIHYKTASICIPPNYVKKVKEIFGQELEKNQVEICTVIGFPLGYSSTEVKVYETQKAIQDGATEIDMVINLGMVKNQEWHEIKKEIMEIRRGCKKNILKVIVETCFLTKDEKIKMCQIVTEAKADFIKTSTGFGVAGATIEDIQLFKEFLGQEVKIKASGGISSIQDMEGFLKAGSQRLGTSKAIGLIKERE